MVSRCLTHNFHDWKQTSRLIDGEVRNFRQRLCRGCGVIEREDPKTGQISKIYV